MLGLLLAAGQGSRLVASVGGRAKPLVRVGNRTLIENAGAMLTYLGASEVVVMCRVADKVAIEAVYNACGDLAPSRVIGVKTASGLETLLRARDIVDTQPFLLSCVDSVIPQRQLAAMKAEMASVTNGAFLVGCTPARNAVDGTFVFLERGKATAIGKDLAPQPLTTAGIYGCPADFAVDLDVAAAARLGHLGSYLGWFCETKRPGTPVVFQTCFDVDNACDLREAETYLRTELEQ